MSTEFETLKNDLRRKLVTRQDFNEQLKKLPLSDILQMGYSSLKAIQSPDILRQYSLGLTTQYKMKFILSWLKKINRPDDINRREINFLDTLQELDPEILIVNLNNNINQQEEEEDEVNDPNLPIIQKNYERNPRKDNQQTINQPSTSNQSSTMNQPSTSSSIIIRDNEQDTQNPRPAYVNPLKRKFINFNLHRENIQIEYDTTKKIRKTVYKQEEMPIPSQWKPWSAFLMEPIFLIKHESLKPAEIRDTIIKNIEQGKLPAIIGTFITGKDALRIKSPDNLTRKNNMAKLKEWLPELQILKPKVFDPKIRLIRVKYEGSLTDLEAMKNMITNIWQTAELHEAGDYSIDAAYTSNLLNHIDIIITVSPSVRDKIHEKRGVIYYLGNEIKIADYFTVTSCPRCFSYQHREKHCQAQQRCKLCSLLHAWRECPNINKPELYNCINCKGSQKNYQHSADDWDCPTYQKKLREAIQLINYEYRWIIKV
ncbi:uncharacterized protein LOC128387029 [Panonychus citri]|uniref:uncharacterized protein LOC128387029 n=1 Tax=Panonychus citri TaxID=50023 RepID=UPI002307F0E6|nr:uncharacterized protein LOC128387029 [Panonychus citri]